MNEDEGVEEDARRGGGGQDRGQAPRAPSCPSGWDEMKTRVWIMKPTPPS